MQYHTAAILLSFMNRKDTKVFRIRGQNKSYDAQIRSDQGNKVKIDVGGLWKCYSELYVDDRGSVMNVEIKHPDESSRTIDVVKIQSDDRLEGIFYSEDGKRYPFTGTFRNKYTILDGTLTNKKNVRVDFRFELV
ncbi:MAG: hypothetical protein WDZ94_03175 [Patescibacteria group bacterium]